MKSPENGKNNMEIVKAIKDSLEDAKDAVGHIEGLFKETVQPLRLEENEEVFTNLEHNFHNLQCYLEFVSELKTGMNYINGLGIQSNPLLNEDIGMNIFKEMQSAFESKDWIMLSDLVEYELNPLLIKENEWLDVLNEKLTEYNVSA